MERFQLCVSLVFDPFNRQELLEVYLVVLYFCSRAKTQGCSTGFDLDFSGGASQPWRPGPGAGRICQVIFPCVADCVSVAWVRSGTFSDSFGINATHAVHRRFYSGQQV